MIIAELILILIAVFILPFLVKKIEEELEIFLFLMGVLAVTVTKQWSFHIIEEALIEPIKITLAVLIAGLLFNRFQNLIAKKVKSILDFLGLKLFLFTFVVLLGLLSSIITAIIAALILVEVISHINLDRKTEIKIVVFSCFSIGFGAALTPIGEPLSTIAISKLKGEPYNAGFFFLLNNLWYFIIPAIIAISLILIFIVKEGSRQVHGLKEEKKENMKNIFIRTGKVYLFVMALVFLGHGFKILIDMYISKIPFLVLYWINIISAVLDNATLVAAEISPVMKINQIKGALLGLIISGGMLIPGNIPNIIAASKLKIKSKEWAKIGVPLGFIFLVVYFIILFLFERS